MKIDLSPAAVRLRLEQVEALRRLCLSLARSSAGRRVMEKHPADENVKRTAAALGRDPEEDARCTILARRPRAADRLH